MKTGRITGQFQRSDAEIEHVFATIKTSMNNAMNIRSIGINRAKFNVALTNLT